MDYKIEEADIMKQKLYLLAAMLFVSLPGVASAYVGPGAGLSAIGSLLALLLAIVVAFVGFFWYPIKRLIGGKKGGATIEEDTIEVEQDAVAVKEKSE
ncbi:MAG: hypothetical protein D6160_06620 [Ketobacter sp.]|nr:MAG: hypothetical protein D6160_06620 [Ketobacter sp.]